MQSTEEAEEEIPTSWLEKGLWTGNVPPSLEETCCPSMKRGMKGGGMSAENELVVWTLRIESFCTHGRILTL